MLSELWEVFETAMVALIEMHLNAQAIPQRMPAEPIRR
jgi:hypothetical protein